MPTGVALHDARARLFAAAEQVLERDGAGSLTSRAVTEEAGVAKGVLHRHFADFDDFLAELVRERIARVKADIEGLRGADPLVANVSNALSWTLAPVNLRLVNTVIARDELRARLRETSPQGLPILTEATAALAYYLDAERRAGRLKADTEVRTLAMTLVGTGHLLFAGEPDGRPSTAAVQEVVASMLVGAETGARR
ncbi:TetR/AcrR family transcriptional regulator [Glycomyces sp. NPDC047010]|uniref:TetR/AcrR family transcriptional regulator n=1 Tax=Glycomyces sp. NPDC047010 TaxID=3155023 RepID=UPI0033D3DC77